MSHSVLKSDGWNGLIIVYECALYVWAMFSVQIGSPPNQSPSPLRNLNRRNTNPIKSKLRWIFISKTSNNKKAVKNSSIYSDRLRKKEEKEDANGIRYTISVQNSWSDGYGTFLWWYMYAVMETSVANIHMLSPK